MDIKTLRMLHKMHVFETKDPWIRNCHGGWEAINIYNILYVYPTHRDDGKVFVRIQSNHYSGSYLLDLSTWVFDV